jgi:hypothetical protein
VPSFRPLYSTYYGPADQFRIMTLGNTAMGCVCFMISCRNIHILALLMAVFTDLKKSFHFFKKRSSSYDETSGALRTNTLDPKCKGI